MVQKLRVAVFPFENIVLYPHTDIPLYVFARNYIQMIEDSIKHNFLIAMGLGDPVLDPHGRPMPGLLYPKSIMGLGKARIVKRLEEGTLSVIIEGMGRVKLERAVQNLPYLLCEATTMTEEVPTHDELTSPSLKPLDALITTWITNHLLGPEQRIELLEKIKNPQALVDYISLLLIKDPGLKQILLESNSLGDKTEILNLLLHGPNQAKEDPIVGDGLKKFEDIERVSNFQN
jgi:Lon protease-like protein